MNSPGFRVGLAQAFVVLALGTAACGDPETSGRRERVTFDRPDEDQAPSVHVVYALPSDGMDSELDVRGDLARSVAAWNGWLAARTPERKLRLDLYDGALDVSFVRLPWTDAALAAEGEHLRDALERLLDEAVGLSATKLYAVYYGGSHPLRCADGPLPPDLVGHVAAVYLRGTPPGARACATNALARSPDAPGYLEFTMLHELLHAQGAVAPCAPNAGASGHVTSDPTDLMYAGAAPWAPSQLDVDRDDYFGHGRTDCLDLARSAFLTPSLDGAALPPGW